MSKHNVYAKVLSKPQYKQRIVKAKKGKGAYTRKCSKSVDCD
jgi:stalled ribosome alternative rescue factor ArfA